VLELAENGSLHSSLYSHDQTFSRKQIYKLYHEICTAVNYLHSLDIMHGDIKPGNILLGPSGQVKLADFGCASELISRRM
jgi:serine/threonine protein kinase